MTLIIPLETTATVALGMKTWMELLLNEKAYTVMTMRTVEKKFLKC
jgi:hypothetical protein